MTIYNFKEKLQKWLNYEWTSKLVWDATQLWQSRPGADL